MNKLELINEISALAAAVSKQLRETGNNYIIDLTVFNNPTTPIQANALATMEYVGSIQSGRFAVYRHPKT